MPELKLVHSADVMMTLAQTFCVIVLLDILIRFLLDLWSVISIVSLDLFLGLLFHLFALMPKWHHACLLFAIGEQCCLRGSVGIWVS